MSVSPVLRIAETPRRTPLDLLVIYPPAVKEKALSLEESLKEQGLFPCWREMGPKDSGELVSLLPKYPCVLMCLEPPAEEENWYHFLQGYCLGSGIPGAVFSQNDNREFFRTALAFRELDKLLEFLQEERKNWIRREEIRKAQESLKGLGYSFNSDAFAYAVMEGDIKAASLFIAGEFSVNGVNSRGTPLLCLAARGGHQETLELLIKSGADINAISRDRGNTPLMDAASQGNPDIVRFLIASGAELDHISRGGQTALILAVGRKNARVAKLLIEAGAGLTVKDSLGMDALQYARLFKLEDVEQEILARSGMSPGGPPDRPEGTNRG